MLDFNDISRADKYGELLKKSNAKKVLIDHHQDPDHSIADLIFSDTSSLQHVNYYLKYSNIWAIPIA